MGVINCEPEGQLEQNEPPLHGHAHCLFNGRFLTLAHDILSPTPIIIPLQEFPMHYTISDMGVTVHTINDFTVVKRVFK